jgi:hypothetical protein
MASFSPRLFLPLTTLIGTHQEDPNLRCHYLDADDAGTLLVLDPGPTGLEAVLGRSLEDHRTEAVHRTHQEVLDHTAVPAAGGRSQAQSCIPLVLAHRTAEAELGIPGFGRSAAEEADSSSAEGTGCIAEEGCCGIAEEEYCGTAAAGVGRCILPDPDRAVRCHQCLARR